MRPGHRSHRRAHGLEARPVQAIAPALARHAIVASNTSGLSITKLSEVLPEAIKPRFCGIHFFNPPRYMYPGGADQHAGHRPEVLDQLEAFVTSALGKGVVRAKDTPNFIANRVGIAGMLATMKEAETFGLGYDVVDDLTGKKLGRASRAPSAPPTWWAWTRWRTSSRRCRTTWPTTRSSPATPRPGAGGAAREGRAGPEDRRRLLQEGRQGHPASSTPPRVSTCRPAARPTRSSAACSRSRPRIG
jgi:hypothetical protein